MMHFIYFKKLVKKNTLLDIEKPSLKPKIPWRKRNILFSLERTDA